MGLLERIKVALGLEPRDRADRAESSGEDVAVTVEHDPETASEDAVKGTDTATEDGASVEESTDEDEDEESTEGSTDEPTDGTDEDEDEASVEESTAEPTDETDDEASEQPDESTSESGDGSAAGADVQSIDGIGPAYAERLGEAGIETVGDLAGADAATVAEETGIAEGRVSTWIERAGE